MLITVNVEGLAVLGGLRVTIDEDKYVQELIDLFCQSIVFQIDSFELVKNVEVSDDYIIANAKGDAFKGSLKISDFHVENNENLFIISKNSIGPEMLNFVNWHLISFAAIVIGLFGIGAVFYAYFFNLYTPDNYAIVFDAGSTHTEAILYKWPGAKTNDTGNVEQVESCTLKMGISSIDVLNVSSYLRPCLNQVSKNIPNQSLSKTRVFFGATAGMRLFREQNSTKAEALMEEVRRFFSTSQFVFNESNIEIISGEVEALSGWISSNYLYRTFDSQNETRGALDLGGASTQMSFEVQDILVPDDTTTLELFGKVINVVRKSFLCYGIQQAFKRYRALILHENWKQGSNVINSPCEPKGSLVKLTHDQLFNSPCLSRSFEVSNSTNANYTFAGTGNITQCQNFVRVLLSQNFCLKFNLTDCINSTILTEHGKDKFLAFSMYGHVMEDLDLGNQTSLKEYKMKAEQVCSLALQEILDLDSKRYTHLGLKIWTELCFDTQFVLTLLTDVYKFETEEKWGRIQFSTKINNTSVGWALGFAVNKSKEIPPIELISKEGTAIFIFLLFLFIIFVGLGIVIFIKGMKLRICNYNYQRKMKMRIDRISQHW